MSSESVPERKPSDWSHDVDARIAAHRAAIAADINVGPKRQRRQRRKPKALQLIEARREAQLFEAPATRPDTYGQTRAKRQVPAAPPLKPVPIVRHKRAQCYPCQRNLVVREGKVICPACGDIFGDVEVLRRLRDAFGPIEFIDESDID